MTHIFVPYIITQYQDGTVALSGWLVTFDTARMGEHVGYLLAKAVVSCFITLVYNSPSLSRTMTFSPHSGSLLNAVC